MDRNTWIGLTIAALCLVFVFYTSDGGKNTEVDALLDATMAIHDEAMAEMAEMNRLGRALKQDLVALDSLSPRADSIHIILGQIKKAEEGMYDWMRNYEPPKDLPADEAKIYLEDQKEKISRNQADIRAAREAARKAKM